MVTNKTFYLLTLLAVTTLGVINLLMLRFQIKKDNNITNINLVKSIDFITLAVSSWLMVAFYKLFDIDEFSLKFITNDRFLSALSNLFLLLSLPHLPDNNSLIKKYFKLFPIIKLFGRDTSSSKIMYYSLYRNQFFN
jgi:hypothetical protein